jgi:hypothetical protein
VTQYAIEFMGAVCVYVGGASVLVTVMLLCWSITLSVADAMKGRSWQKRERK